MDAAALLPLLLLAVVFYLLILRPARKRQADQKATIAALEPGRRVMTSGGLFGTVVAVRPDRIELEIADGVHVEFVPQAIGQVVPEPAADDDSEPDPFDEIVADVGDLGDSTDPGRDTGGDTPPR
ncbi:MAG TPA: preprotein translocase subunit YajC [Candidatus Nanopelagicales bacterium]|nr:preprotein translocase subunit YajC [Candidatus Nanopelagicales bacterium]